MCEVCNYCLWLGGIKCSGRMLGNSFPSIFTLIKCIARANSSMSKKPSQSTSDNFHIFDKTEFGSFDLMSSDFAAKIDNSKSNGKKSLSHRLTCSANLSIDGIQCFEQWIRSSAITATNPFHLTRSSIDTFSALIAER